ncbi:MAG TPA: efflux RND transporter permease subunit, partial [Fimbriimonadaceae bacterium]|nr:efflux RND transporter permease subunit [Fimbriimonadaceae bacterium]
IYVAQPYGGVDPAQMEGFISYYYEYHFLYITGIEHVESKSVQGNALLKLQFHAGTDMAQAMAETVSYVNRARAFMPPGTLPPFVMRFDAGSVPVGNLVFSSATRSVAEIQDAALNRVRPLFATLPGVSAPPPFGGSARTIVVRADPDRLKAYDMSPDEVVAAISAANTIVPSGNVRIGDMMPIVPTNATVSNIKDLESVPIRVGSAQTVFVRDIGTVEDGTDIATGYALVNGRRTVFIPVTKRADASTLSVVALVKENLKKFQSVLPDGVEVSYQFDQSPYVSGAITNLVWEAALGAVLTGFMVFLFLRDPRSALIVLLNIPLALLGGLVGLWLTRQTVNIMTLGGLALAVGILVDEATVAIENTHVHLAAGESSRTSALRAGLDTAVPRLLAMLCILAVFTPALLMTGAARALFLPLALAVGFAMIASYLLSSTLVPVLCARFLRAGSVHEAPGFRALQDRYGAITGRLIAVRRPLLWLYLLASVVLTLVVVPRLGTEIFPKTDASQFQVRLRAPAGTRIEKTEALTLKVLDDVRDAVGEKNLSLSLAFIGVQPPSYPVNTIYIWTSGPEEAVLQVQINAEARVSIPELRDSLRRRLAQEHPDLRLSFEPNDIVSRVMSFGAPTPVEISVTSPSLQASHDYAAKIGEAIGQLSYVRDIELNPSLDYPTIKVDVDRQRAGLASITEADVARAAVVSTSSSRFTAPNFWADSKSGISYNVQVQVPVEKMGSIEDVRNMPVQGKGGSAVRLRDVADVTQGIAPGEYDRYNSQRTITVTANLEAIDLGRANRDIAGVLAGLGPLPPKTTVRVGGQGPALEEILAGFRTGLGVAAVAILLLLAANFQSLRLPVIVLVTLPAVVAGVSVALWLTRTTLNVQSATGAIMAIGIAVANSILLVTFAERSRSSGQSAADAAVTGAKSRLRPILMTSLAMMAGMVPMSLGLGEGGGQTAPLGRAVIGGLFAATLATLFVVPAAFAAVQARAGQGPASLHPEDEAAPEGS